VTNEMGFFNINRKANTMTPENYNRSPSNGFEPNNKELENLLSLYDDDAEHFSPKKPTNQKQMAS
jgi:hypothetical protein